jgi:hypothetical protein
MVVGPTRRSDRTLVEARQTAWFDAEQGGITSIAIAAEADADAYVIAYSGSGPGASAPSPTTRPRPTPPSEQRSTSRAVN